jgi:hypothetical protein
MIVKGELLRGTSWFRKRKGEGEGVGGGNIIEVHYIYVITYI